LRSDSFFSEGKGRREKGKVRSEKRKMKREEREGIKLLGCARGDWQEGMR